MKIIEAINLVRIDDFLKVDFLVESGFIFKKREVRTACARHLSTLDDYVEWEWIDYGEFARSSVMTSLLRKLIYKEKFNQ